MDWDQFEEVAIRCFVVLHMEYKINIRPYRLTALLITISPNNHKPVTLISLLIYDYCMAGDSVRVGI